LLIYPREAFKIRAEHFESNSTSAHNILGSTQNLRKTLREARNGANMQPKQWQTCSPSNGHQLVPIPVGGSIVFRAVSTPNEACSFTPKEAGLVNPKEARSFTQKGARSFTPKEAGLFNPNEVRSFTPKEAGIVNPNEASSFTQNEALKIRAEHFESNSKSALNILGSTQNPRKTFREARNGANMQPKQWQTCSPSSGHQLVPIPVGGSIAFRAVSTPKPQGEYRAVHIWHGTALLHWFLGGETE
jgi:hypothetical protein